MKAKMIASDPRTVGGGPKPGRREHALKNRLEITLDPEKTLLYCPPA
jgi:hypothetical protein